MLIEAVLISTFTMVTAYQPVPEQTKPECRGRYACTTSVGENVSELGAAVSQDLLASGKVRYYDVLYIDGLGYRIVFDTMHPRIHNAVDIFVYTKAMEKAIGTRHLKVWVIHNNGPKLLKGLHHVPKLSH